MFLNLEVHACTSKCPKSFRRESLLKGTLEPTNEGYALAKITIAKYCSYIAKEKKLNYKTVIPCTMVLLIISIWIQLI